MSSKILSKKSYAMNIGSTQRNILQSLNEERKQNGFSSCEVILLTNGVKHFAHKIVLVTCSDYFRLHFKTKPESKRLLSKNIDEDMSTSSEYESSDDIESSPKTTRERSKTIVPLPGIKPEELSLILEYMYTSKLRLTAKNVNGILLGACFLQITSVIEFCAEVLMKQPNWRSPLVSSKLKNFVKNKTLESNETSTKSTNFSENLSDLSTEETPTANSARKSPFELKILPQRHSCERLENTMFNNKRILKVRNKHTIRHRRNENTTRSRRYEQSNQYLNEFEDKRAKHEGFEYSSPNEFSSSDSAAEFTIDAEQLNRKLIKDYHLEESKQNIQAMEFRNSMYNNLSGISNQRKFHLGQKLNMVANSIHSDSPYFIQEPSNRSIPMFPQTSDCSRKIAAAYASSLGVPSMNSKYFGPIFPPLIYPQFRRTMVNQANSTNTSFQNDEVNRDLKEQIPMNKYSGRITAFCIHPGHPQNYHVMGESLQKTPKPVLKQNSAPPNFRSHFTTTKSMKYNPSDKETACAQSLLDLTYRPRVKHFSPSIVQKQNTILEESSNFHNSDTHEKNKVERNNSKNQNPQSADAVHKQDLVLTTSCEMSLITDPTTNIRSENMKPFFEDHNIRKRKLLLGAITTEPESETDPKPKVAKSVGNVCPGSPTIHYLTRNDNSKFFSKNVVKSGRPVSA